MSQRRAPRAATRTRYQARIRKALPRARKAPQRAPEAQQATEKNPADFTPAQQRQMLYIALQLLSNRVAAPELDPWKWGSRDTLAWYSRVWGYVGLMGFDRRDILSPGEVEERLERATLAALLEDVELTF